MVVDLLKFTGRDHPFGNGQGKEVFRKLIDFVDQHPTVRTFGFSLAGIVATDASFPRESVIALAKHLRGEKGIFLTDLYNRDVIDNWNYAAKAKELELADWPYPRHLAGRAFSIVVHGDSTGVDALSGSLSSWLEDMGLLAAGHHSELARYIGYYGSYAESHDALDDDEAVQQEVRLAATSLAEAVKLLRSGEFPQPGEKLKSPRPK